MGLLRWFSQVWAVTLLNLRTIGQRRGSSAAAVFGVAGVVMVFVAVLSIAEGFRATLAATGSPASVIVMRGGSDSEMMSGISRDNARIVADGPRVQRTAQGEAASAELYVVVSLPKRSTRTDANVPLRGVQPAAFAVRKDVHLVAGRMFQWGHNEVIAGVGARPRWFVCGLSLLVLVPSPGRERVARGGPLRERRLALGVRDLDRRGPADAGLPPHHVPVGAPRARRCREL